MTETTPYTDPAALNEAGRITWSSGDFNVIARQTMGVAEDLVRAADPRPGQVVLDVACGSGNVALVAARRYCEVTGVDIAENLIETARRRAAAEGTDARFLCEDAQALPFPDASFDVVLSAFGVMFAPDQERTAAEILRVCRPGGTIALANWMPQDFGSRFFGAHARHAPPPAGAPWPLRWGTDEGLDALIGPGVGVIRSSVSTGYAHYRSIEHAVAVFERYFGPTIRALDRVGPTGAEALRRDLAAVLQAFNRANDGTAVIETRYLRSLAIRQ